MASEIVVGIDFGTTYSGVSWAVNAGTKTVRLINDWPDPVNPVANSEKVPTAISYENGLPHSFGYNVPPVGRGLRWFKLLLDPKHSYARTREAITSRKQIDNLHKTPEDVASDYLRMIWSYTKEDISRVKGDGWESLYLLKIVLTVPAIWTPAARDRTKRVAEMAGIPGEIHLVTEPEAAALAVLKDRNDEDDANLKTGDAFVVCDAGGGTVDLISYKVSGVDPLRIEECAVGDDKSKQKMMREFEAAVKRSYAGDNKDYSVDLQGVDDDLAEGIDDDTITLKANSVKTIFDIVINKISHLVDKQVEESKDNDVDAILLVGGFGANKYLHNRLKLSNKSQNIQVLQVNGAWSSICRGATLWGLENSTRRDAGASKTVASRLARYSYGHCWNVIFDPSIHRIEDRVVGMDGVIRATNQMNWVIKKGDRIEENRLISVPCCGILGRVGFRSVMKGGAETSGVELLYCADDEPPAGKGTSVKPLCSVSWEIEHAKLYAERSQKGANGTKFTSPKFELRVLLGGAAIQFSVYYKGEEVAHTKAKYKEEFVTSFTV
ncbi:hypothetical protein FKW77_010834 [Venturia effusa]|uniref:Actin-like ATPase domain-containing protein n=1 Tax=Venturia effusa TaxID=50376 RepID=A0A517KYK1_9PEZI|nr:hypothetical protein FKW77_010834 [Venturia effusa]